MLLTCQAQQYASTQQLLIYFYSGGSRYLIAELRMQLKALQARLDSWSNKPSRLAILLRHWLRVLTKANFKGDLRYRHEAFSIDEKRHDTVTGFVHDCRQPKRSKRT